MDWGPSGKDYRGGISGGVLASSECYLRDINCELGRRGNLQREEGLIFGNYGEPRWDSCMTQGWLNVV